MQHVSVRVHLNAKKARVKKDGDSFIIDVREAPKNGNANKAVISQLRSYLKTDERMQIVSGHKSQHKILKIGN